MSNVKQDIVRLLKTYPEIAYNMDIDEGSVVVIELAKFVEAVAKEAIGNKETSGFYNTVSGNEICMACYEDDYCIHEIRNELRDEQLKTLKKIQGK